MMLQANRTFGVPSDTCRVRRRPVLCTLIALVALLSARAVTAELSKGYRVLMNRGLQLQGMVTTGDVFHLNNYSNANFNTINWIFDSNTSLQGPAPGFPWARWVSGETNMPPVGGEAAYLSQLVNLQLGDEWDLNTDSIRTRLVNWFNSVSNQWPNTILYHNNWAGQIGDGQLSDFIARAHPDMLCFDGYPWQSDYYTGAPLGWDRPNNLLSDKFIGLYSELRRYRAWSLFYGVPFGMYRDTFHAVQDYNNTVYRDPSPSELRLNTMIGLLFNAKAFINFTYNTGASSLFTNPGGDSYPTPLYAEQQLVNRRAQNLGKALAYLTPLYELHNQNDTNNPPPGVASSDPCACWQDGCVSSIMILRGRYIYGGVTNFTDIPNSFLADPEVVADPAAANPLAYTWWEYTKNDPYFIGFGHTNIANSMNNGLPGDLFIAWFRPLDESFDGTTYSNEVYFMVVNALVATNGTAADCRQEMHMDFSFGTSGISNVVMLNPDTGLLTTNATTVVNSSKRRLTLDLDGGDAALFKFNDGAPFVGFYPRVPRLSVQTQSAVPTLSVEGTLGQRYQIQGTTSLSPTNWTTLADISLSVSPLVWTDPGFSTNRTRFYRAVGIAR
jgi:hypothetical protein